LGRDPVVSKIGARSWGSEHEREVKKEVWGKANIFQTTV